MPTQRSRRNRVAGELRGLPQHAFVPALALGGAMQLAAAVVGDLRLAVGGLMIGALTDLVTSRSVPPWRARLEKLGVGLIQRASLRALLVLAAVAATPVARSTVVVFVVLMIAAAAASRVWHWACDKVLFTEPAVGVRNLAGDPTETADFDATRRRQVLGSALLVAIELPAGVVLVASASDVLGAGPAAWMLGGGLFLAVAVAAAGLTWSVTFRRSGRVAQHLTALRAKLRSHGAVVLVYFSGDPASTYQLDQWIAAIDRLTVPVLIVLRERGHVEHLAPTRWPILLCPRTRDVEEAVTPSARVALYVSNSGRNIHLQRFVGLRHVFLNHGDSDKASSANPVVRAYDYLFVAGELAIDRYQRAGVDVPRDRFRVVGRPQLDGVTAGPRPGADRPTILYAPTWEGFFDEADYSSVERMGLDLVSGIVRRRPDARIIFRPHPLSGRVRKQARAAVSRIQRLLQDSPGGHVVDIDGPSTGLLDLFAAADVLVTDISAVATDWLATERPYLVTNPRGLPPAVFAAAYPSQRGAYVVGPDLIGLDDALERALADDPLAETRREMRRLVLGQHEEGPMASFDDAVREIASFDPR